MKCFFNILISAGCLFSEKVRLAAVLSLIGNLLILVNILSFLASFLNQITMPYFGFAIILFSWAVQLGLGLSQFWIESPVKEKTPPKAKKAIVIEEKSKNRLFGMIKIEKKINLSDASKYIKIPKDEIKGLIYDLAGEGKIEGEFQGEDFVITSNINDFLDVLDNGFKQWESSKDKI